MRRAILLLSAAALVLSACADDASNPSAPGTLSPSPSLPAGEGGHYQGPDVAFDIPRGWHEFYLEVPMRYYAAYGPVSGGDEDYVVIAPVPPEEAGRPPEEILEAPPMRTGPVKRIDVNGMPGYSVPLALTGSDGQTLEGQETLVEGQRGDYLVVCQYGEQMREQVPIGCEMLKNTLVETPSPTITDPSACTDAELALLSIVPMPDGTDPEEPKGLQKEWQHVCDLMVVPSPPAVSYEGDLVGYFRSRLTDAGWHVEKPKVARKMGPFQVWQVFADRDWDFYMIEIYVDVKGTVVAKGAAQHFFVTVIDG